MFSSTGSSMAHQCVVRDVRERKKEEKRNKKEKQNAMRLNKVHATSSDHIQYASILRSGHEGGVQWRAFGVIGIGEPARQHVVVSAHTFHVSSREIGEGIIV